MADFPPTDISDGASELNQRAIDRLRDVLKGTEQRRRLSQLTGIPAPTLKDYFTGRSSPPLDRFLLIVSAAGLRPGAFFGSDTFPSASGPIAPDLAQTIAVPVLDVRASAGAGFVADVVRAEAVFPFPLYFLRRLIGERANSARLESLRAHGDSMMPTIENGALLIVDRAQHDLPPPLKHSSKLRRNVASAPIFVFHQGEDIRLKRLRRIDDKFVAVISDNTDEYPVEIIQPGVHGTLKIIGKVIWWDNRL